MSFKNILFDLDGTITNTFEGITNSIYHSLKYYPHITPPNREALLPFIGPPLTVSYSRIFGMDEQTAKEAVEHYREYYREKGIFELSLYDGIAEFIRELSEKGYKVILATSKPEHFARRIIEHFDIAKYFFAVCGDTMDGKLGKKQDVICKLIEENALEKEETLMVGDTHYDIIGAAMNDIKCVCVTYGFGDPELNAQAKPFKTVDSVQELREFILNNYQVVREQQAAPLPM